MMVFVGR